MAKVYWTERALKDLDKLDKVLARRIVNKLGWFSSHFEKLVPEPLTGEFKGAFKLRVGQWRLIYTVEGKAIIIQFVGHRRDIYKV